MITGNSVSVMIGSDLKVFAKGSDEYEKVVEFIKGDDEKGLVKYLTDFQNKVAKRSNGVFRVEEGLIFMKDADGVEAVVPRVFGERVRQFFNEGLPFGPLVKFWERLCRNPSYDTVQRLFDCLEKNNHPILTDGRFLAWKRVRDDRKDFFSGKFDNSDGAKPSMPRNAVNDDHTQTCMSGLHVSSFDYAKHHYHSGSGVLVEVAVDPSDVISVPFDYNDQKMRTCTYEVLREIKEERKDTLSKVYDEEGDFDTYGDEDDEDNSDLDYCSNCGEMDCCGECTEDEGYCDECGEMWDRCVCEDE